jgi:hypothetical protein
MEDDELIETIARAMGSADRVFYWKDGYPDQERLTELYTCAARRHLVAHRILTDVK